MSSTEVNTKPKEEKDKNEENKEVDFNLLNISISDIFKKYPIEKQRDIFQYLSEMDDLNKKAYEIAYHHLGTSFNIARSNGFKDWLTNKKTI
jgi:hypothetical protein